MTNERWRTVPSEPRYEVSDRGRVRSKDFIISSIDSRTGTVYKRMHRGRLLKGALQPRGYLDITVESKRFINGKRVPLLRSIASMVLEAFVGKRPSKRHQARHLDDRKTNNRLSNLAWGLPVDNSADRDRNGLGYRPKGELHHKAKLTNDQVRQIRKVYRRYGKEHIKLAKRFGITGENARWIGRGKGWPHVT
jgi:hypothetical protein